MSPTSITRAEEVRKRREQDQKRREELAKKVISKPRPAPAQPRLNQTPRSLHSVKAPLPADAGRHSRRYDIAMSAPYGRESAPAKTWHAPTLTRRIELAEIMPKFGFGARWISFLLIALCGAALYFITSDNLFTVNSASVLGNNRVSAQQISSILGAMGKSSIMLNPAQMEYNVLAAFPDIRAVQVDVNLPAQVVVTVSERQPVAAWKQDGQVAWVDAQGYAFPPRGLVEGLVTVSATGLPPSPPNVDMTQALGAHRLLSAEMATALMTLSPRLPKGSALIYDPRYGLGWSDPRGWQTYFGNSVNDISIKLRVYQAVLDDLAKRGVTPKLVSVEYPDAPFYRVEQP